MIALWIVTYWQPEISTVFVIGVAKSYEEAIACMRRYKKWEEGRYQKRGPSKLEGSKETYWDTTISSQYYSFEIALMRGKNEQSLLAEFVGQMN